MGAWSMRRCRLWTWLPKNRVDHWEFPLIRNAVMGGAGAGPQRSEGL